MDFSLILNCTMALGSIQRRKEMSTRKISWEQSRSVRKTDNLPQSCAVVTKSWKLNFWEPSWPVEACNGTAFATRFGTHASSSGRRAF